MSTLRPLGSVILIGMLIISIVGQFFFRRRRSVKHEGLWLVVGKVGSRGT